MVRLPPARRQAPFLKSLSLFRNEHLKQPAIFNFQSLLLVVVLIICTCTYVREAAPSLVDRNKEG